MRVRRRGVVLVVDGAILSAALVVIVVDLLLGPAAVQGFADRLPLARDRCCRRRLVIAAAGAVSSRDPRNSDDFSALFSTTPSYVPSGMTPDEYQSLKNAEAQRISKLRFGAWGPKFMWKTSSAANRPPDGDWMVMPRLWTHGAGGESTPHYGATDPAGGAASTPPNLLRARRRRSKLAAAMLLWIAMEALVRALVVVLPSSSFALKGRLVMESRPLRFGRHVLQAALAVALVRPVQSLGRRMIAKTKAERA
jgi:hypothetical protein